MGFSIACVLVKSQDKGEVLSRIGYLDTEKLDFENKAKMRAARLSTGWVVIWSEDFDYPTPERLAVLSSGTELVAFRVEERVMVSEAWGYADGRMVWRLDYDSEQYDVEDRDVVVEGAPPSVFAGVLAKAKAQQRAVDEDAEDDPVDYVFEVPSDVCAAITGFKHNEYDEETGEPAFTAIRPAQPERRSLLARLFGR